MKTYGYVRNVMELRVCTLSMTNSSRSVMVIASGRCNMYFVVSLCLHPVRGSQMKTKDLRMNWLFIQFLSQVYCSSCCGWLLVLMFDRLMKQAIIRLLMG